MKNFFYTIFMIVIAMFTGFTICKVVNEQPIEQCIDNYPDYNPESLIAVNQLGLALQQSERNNKELADALDKVLKDNAEMTKMMIEAGEMIIKLVNIIEGFELEKDKVT